MTAPQLTAERSPGFFALAARADVVGRAGRTAALVGTVLIMINQGDVLLAGAWPAFSWLKAALTFGVPYGVSTYASVRAIQTHGQRP